MNTTNYAENKFISSQEDKARERIKYLKKMNKITFNKRNKDLKVERNYIRLIMLFLILFSLFLFFNPTSIYSQSHPTSYSDLMFFVESNPPNGSFSLGSNHIAFCESDFCLNHANTENAVIIEQYCDVTNSCGEGCVRRWIDQSTYIPSSGFILPEYSYGRNFGQDDSEKPCYISNCINGKPCIRGGAPYGTFTQDKYLELQISDFMNLPDDFSIFMLAKPIDQSGTGDWFYFGQSSHFLRHDVSQNKLKLRVPGNFQTVISTNNSIKLNKWQLIEIHRNNSGLISVFVNGIDKTLSDSIVLNGNFQIGYLLSNFKTTGQLNQTAMYGDIASFLVYERDLDASEKLDIRQYFNINYLDDTLDIINTKELSGLSIHIESDNIKITNEHLIFIDKVLIYNLLGKKIKSVEIQSNETKIKSPVPYLAKGMYVVQTISDDNRMMTKIINN